MTKFAQTYPTDLKYSESWLLAQFFPPSLRGRPRKWEGWLILNASLYVTRTGSQWWRACLAGSVAIAVWRAIMSIQLLPVKR